jgi:transcriptional regulator with XRE-family HTH domain
LRLLYSIWQEPLSAELPVGRIRKIVAMNQSASAMRGRVLQAWRDYAKLSLSELAERAHLGISTLSMWEHGARGRRTAQSLGTARKIADALDLSPDHSAAMIGLWQSGNSVDAQPPRQFWAHNYPGPSRPAWAWLRPSNGHAETVAKLWWGISLQRQLILDRPPTGIFVQFPATVPNPALEIRFSRPGWADFGLGEIPAEVAETLGIKLIDAYDIVRSRIPPGIPAADGEPRHLRPWIAQVREAAEQIGFRWPLFAPQVERADRRWAPRQLANSTPEAAPNGLTTDSRRTIVTQLLMTPGQIQRLREARGLGRHAASAAATALLPEQRVSPKMLEILETEGRLPEVKAMVSRLNMIYDADGHLGVERVFSTHFAPAGNTPYVSIPFPDFWLGPVWLQFSAPETGATGLAELSWGLWQCQHIVHSGAVVTTRRAPNGARPLRARLPSGWNLVAGIGIVPGAFDINHDWHAASLQAARVILSDILTAVKLPLGAEYTTPSRTDDEAPTASRATRRRSDKKE